VIRHVQYEDEEEEEEEEEGGVNELLPSMC